MLWCHGVLVLRVPTSGRKFEIFETPGVEQKFFDPGNFHNFRNLECKEKKIHIHICGIFEITEISKISELLRVSTLGGKRCMRCLRVVRVLGKAIFRVLFGCMSTKVLLQKRRCENDAFSGSRAGGGHFAGGAILSAFFR